MLPPRHPPVRPPQLLTTLEPTLRRAANLPGMDRYRKVFPAVAHLWILLLHVLQGSPSLRQTHARLSVRTALWRRWGLPHWISRSQLARSSTSRPASGAEQLVAMVFTRAQQQTSADPTLRLLERVQVLDSTFLRLSAALSPWSRHGYGAAEVSVQCGLELAGRLPSYLVLHDRRTNDRTILADRELAPLHGWTLLIDKGYYAHQQFIRLQQAGVDFITRRYAPARYRVCRQYPCPTTPTAQGDQIMADLVIALGSRNNRTSTVVPGLRLIQYQTASGARHEVLTSRHDLAAETVIWLYRQRWQVELFFRLLKQQLGLVRPFGYSHQAVWLSVLMVTVVALLLALVERRRPPEVSRVAWSRALAASVTDYLLLAPP